MINPWKVTSFVLAGALVAGAAVVAPTLAHADAASDESAMQTALAALQQAKASFAAADHDHGGHRTKAAGFTDRAITEAQSGIEWAKSHPR